MEDLNIRSGFFSITVTRDEISVVVKSPGADRISGQVNDGWRILKINGPLDLSMTGILAGITSVLKKVQIPVFVISTFDTDYILVKETTLDKAAEALRKAGNLFVP